MLKVCHSLYPMAFMIKVIVEAEAVENSSEIARDYGLSESMVQCLRRDQATILSGKLKMSSKHAKMSCFTSQQWSGFHIRETKYYIWNVK